MTESLILNKGIKGMSLVNSIIIFGQELFEFMCIIPAVWYLRGFYFRTKNGKKVMTFFLLLCFWNLIYNKLWLRTYKFELTLGVWYLRSFFVPILKSIRLVLTLLSIKNINNQQNEKNNFNTF